MRYEVTVEINAPVDAVWTVLADVDRWPEWNRSISKLKRLNGGSLGQGSLVRISQPRLPSARCLVTDFTPGRAFTMKSRTTGVIRRSDHELRDAGGRTEFRVAMIDFGLTAPLIAMMRGDLIKEYTDMEAYGLKARVEGRPVP
jgi:hypothetical protein